MHGAAGAVRRGAIATHGSTAAIHARAWLCADTSQKWCEQLASWPRPSNDNAYFLAGKRR